MVDESTTSELCGECGKVLTAGDELYALVRDSSVVHRRDPQLDGQRLVVACGPQHLEVLEQEYARRPWSDEELWAGQLTRALTERTPQHRRLSTAELAIASGLSRTQIDRALAWHNRHRRRL